jgi:hypothetical protein
VKVDPAIRPARQKPARIFLRSSPAMVASCALWGVHSIYPGSELGRQWCRFRAGNGIEIEYEANQLDRSKLSGDRTDVKPAVYWWRWLCCLRSAPEPRLA